MFDGETPVSERCGNGVNDCPRKCLFNMCSSVIISESPIPPGIGGVGVSVGRSNVGFLAGLDSSSIGSVLIVMVAEFLLFPFLVFLLIGVASTSG